MQKNSTLKICLISPVPPPLGGIGRWTMLVHHWAKSNPNVSITQVDISPRWRDIDDTVVWKRVLGGGLQFVRDIFKLIYVLVAYRFDAIHLTTSGQLGVIRDYGFVSVAGIFKTPLVYHIRFGRIPHIAKANSREWRLMVRVMRKSHTIIAIDTATYNTIREYLPEVNVTLIPNCIKLPELQASGTSDRSCRAALFLGWVIPTKGVAELLEAWSAIQPQGWKLQIVGPGNDNYRQSLIDQYHPEGVEFLGELPHSQAMELLEACDLFVLPSYTEGFPNVILEAMAFGKAIVATDVGAIPEMLEGNCGILVKPKDVEGLSIALKSLMHDGSKLADLGSRARERATAEYSADSVLNRLWMTWQQVKEN